MMPDAMGGQTKRKLRGATAGAEASARYCRGKRGGGCGYNLRGLPASTTRCPECSHPFDPANPKTYRSRPLRSRLRHAKRAALGLAALLLILAATWGWFFWGWYDEQQALRALKVDPNNSDLVKYAPILTPWPKQHLGPIGFVLDRAVDVGLGGRSDVTDLAPLARLTNLQRLSLYGTGVTDLAPLARLTNLQWLWLDGTRVTGLAPLARLTNLQGLYLQGTHVTDLAPLARLTNLQELSLGDTRVTDLAPLARLTKLQWISLDDTRVTDLAPLARLTTLQWLYLHGHRRDGPRPAGPAQIAGRPGRPPGHHHRSPGRRPPPRPSGLHDHPPVGPASPPSANSPPSAPTPRLRAPPLRGARQRWRSVLARALSPEGTRGVATGGAAGRLAARRATRGKRVFFSFAPAGATGSDEPAKDFPNPARPRVSSLTSRTSSIDLSLAHKTPPPLRGARFHISPSTGCASGG